MKALKFLKEQQRRHINMAESMKVVYFDDELDEAIAELELIQSKINCDNCQKFDTRVNVCYQNGCKDFEDWELWTKIKDT